MTLRAGRSWAEPGRRRPPSTRWCRAGRATPGRSPAARTAWCRCSSGASRSRRRAVVPCRARCRPSPCRRRGYPPCSRARARPLPRCSRWSRRLVAATVPRRCRGRRAWSSWAAPTTRIDCRPPRARCRGSGGSSRRPAVSAIRRAAPPSRGTFARCDTIMSQCIESQTLAVTSPTVTPSARKPSATLTASAICSVVASERVRRRVTLRRPICVVRGRRIRRNNRSKRPSPPALTPDSSPARTDVRAARRKLGSEARSVAPKPTTMLIMIAFAGTPQPGSTPKKRLPMNPSARFANGMPMAIPSSGAGRTEEECSTQIRPADLAPATADRLHDRDLARLLGDHGRHRVRDQHERRDQGEDRSDVQQRREVVEDVLTRPTPGLAHVRELGERDRRLQREQPAPDRSRDGVGTVGIVDAELDGVHARCAGEAVHRGLRGIEHRAVVGDDLAEHHRVAPPRNRDRMRSAVQVGDLHAARRFHPSSDRSGRSSGR